MKYERPDIITDEWDGILIDEHDDLISREEDWI